MIWPIFISRFPHLPKAVGNPKRQNIFDIYFSYIVSSGLSPFPNDACLGKTAEDIFDVCSNTISPFPCLQTDSFLRCDAARQATVAG
jgi:hypothetical protein